MWQPVGAFTVIDKSNGYAVSAHGGRSFDFNGLRLEVYHAEPRKMQGWIARNGFCPVRGGNPFRAGTRICKRWNAADFARLFD